MKKVLLVMVLAVTLQSCYKDRIEALETELALQEETNNLRYSYLQNAIDTVSATLEEMYNSLLERVEAIQTSVEEEAKARQEADDILQSLIDDLEVEVESNAEDIVSLDSLVSLNSSLISDTLIKVEELTNVVNNNHSEVLLALEQANTKLDLMNEELEKAIEGEAEARRMGDLSLASSFTNTINRYNTQIDEVNDKIDALQISNSSQDSSLLALNNTVNNIETVDMCVLYDNLMDFYHSIKHSGAKKKAILLVAISVQQGYSCKS